MGRTFCIGDVHGCLDELEELLDQIAYVPLTDRVVLLGDLLDRGPRGPDVVALARRLGLSAILGNHDERHLRFARHAARAEADPGYRNPMRMSPEQLDEFQALSPDELLWLASLPTMLLLGGDRGWVAVHAGLHPFVDLTQQADGDRLHIRHVDPSTRKTVPLREIEPDLYVAPEGSLYWAEAYMGSHSVVYGHEVHSLEHPRIDRFRSGDYFLGIDTGCCFGGYLTAVELSDPETFYQVKARRQYQTPLKRRPVGGST